MGKKTTKNGMSLSKSFYFKKRRLVEFIFFPKMLWAP